MPLCDLFEYETTDVKGSLAGKTVDYEDHDIATVLYRKDPTPEVNGNCLNSSVMFPGGNTYAIRKVIRRKRYSDGNAVGIMNDSLVIDTSKYCAEFDYGEAG